MTKEDKPNLSPDDSEEFEFANKALELIDKHKTPPVPNTYALWYAYAAKTHEAVVKEVDAALEKGGEISVYDINQIHQAHLSMSELEKKQNEEFSEDFVKELQSVLGLVQKSLDNSESYGESLNECRDIEPASLKPEKFREMVEGLIAQNEEMRSVTEDLSKGLQESQSHIEALQTNLDEARASSLRDALTQLGNRRSFDETLAKEIQSAKEEGTALTLVLADIDHFKRVNDTFGHQVGDGILQTFSALIARNIKGRDTAARYGGEEFAIILPETKAQDAVHLVDKIRLDLEKSRLVIKSSGQSVGKVTSSFGISMLLGDSDDGDELIRRADEKLYAAKKNGRNRIEVDDRSEAA